MRKIGIFYVEIGMPAALRAALRYAIIKMYFYRFWRNQMIAGTLGERITALRVERNESHEGFCRSDAC